MNWKTLIEQVREFVEEKLDYGYKPDEIAKVLSNQQGWTEEELFRHEQFHYENARFTLTQLCNMFELITGSDYEFVEELRQRILWEVNKYGLSHSA